MYSKNQTYRIKINPLQQVYNLIAEKEFDKALNLMLTDKSFKHNGLRHSERYVQAYVQCQYELQQYSKVISLMKNKEITPNKAFLYCARSYAAIDKHEEAIRIFINFVRSDLNKEEIIDYASCYEALGQYPNAIIAYRSFCNRQMDIDILIRLARCYEKMGDIKAATKNYQLMLEQGFKPFKDYCNMPVLEINTQNNNQQALEPKKEPPALLASESLQKDVLSAKAKEFIPANNPRSYLSVCLGIRPPISDTVATNTASSTKKTTPVSYPKDKLSATAKAFVPSGKYSYKSARAQEPQKPKRPYSFFNHFKFDPNSAFQYYNSKKDKGVSAYTEQCALFFCDKNEDMLNYLIKHEKGRPVIEALDLAMAKP